MSNIFLMSGADGRRNPVRFHFERDETDRLTFRAVPRDPTSLEASFLRNVFVRMKRGVQGGINVSQAKTEMAAILASAFKQTAEYAWLKEVGPAQVQTGGGITHNPGSLPSAAISISFKDRRFAEKFEANFVS